jgi:transposase-like protein
LTPPLVLGSARSFFGEPNLAVRRTGSLREGGDELLTFFSFPRVQWKTLRTTNTIERLHEEFRRRVKTQGSLPSEEAALTLLFSLVVSGQIKLRRIDRWRTIAAMLSQHTSEATRTGGRRAIRRTPVTGLTKAFRQ